MMKLAHQPTENNPNLGRNGNRTPNSHSNLKTEGSGSKPPPTIATGMRSNNNNNSNSNREKCKIKEKHVGVSIPLSLEESVMCASSLIAAEIRSGVWVVRDVDNENRDKKSHVSKMSSEDGSVLPVTVAHSKTAQASVKEDRVIVQNENKKQEDAEVISKTHFEGCSSKSLTENQTESQNDTTMSMKECVTTSDDKSSSCDKINDKNDCNPHATASPSTDNPPIAISSRKNLKSHLLTASSAIEQFALEMILPSLLSAGVGDRCDGPDRAFLGTCLILRDVLGMNADSIFFPNETTKLKLGQNEEEKRFTCQILATALIQSALKRLDDSNPKTQSYYQSFTKAVSAYDSSDVNDEFLPHLEKANATVCGITPAGDILPPEENIAACVSFNYAREHHPLTISKNKARQRLLMRGNGEMTTIEQRGENANKHNLTCSLAEANAVCIYMVEDIDIDRLHEEEMTRAAKKRQQDHEETCKIYKRRMSTMLDHDTMYRQDAVGGLYDDKTKGSAVVEFSQQRDGSGGSVSLPGRGMKRPGRVPNPLGGNMMMKDSDRAVVQGMVAHGNSKTSVPRNNMHPGRTYRKASPQNMPLPITSHRSHATPAPPMPANINNRSGSYTMMPGRDKQSPGLSGRTTQLPVTSNRLHVASKTTRGGAGGGIMAHIDNKNTRTYSTIMPHHMDTRPKPSPVSKTNKSCPSPSMTNITTDTPRNTSCVASMMSPPNNNPKKYPHLVKGQGCKTMPMLHKLKHNSASSKSMPSMSQQSFPNTKRNATNSGNAMTAKGATPPTHSLPPPNFVSMSRKNNANMTGEMGSKTDSEAAVLPHGHYQDTSLEQKKNKQHRLLLSLSSSSSSLSSLLSTDDND